MASSALFASSSGRNQSKNLVEFKAGKMTLKGKMVHPDKRKGLLYIYQSDDSLMHFCWKDRTAGTVDDDLIIFPDDCEFKRVDACTTGRVYVLKFKSSSRKLFFWLQDAKTDKDDDNCKKVNELLNNPPTAGSSRSGGGTPDEIHNLLGNMSQQQLMQLFGSFGSGGSGSSQLHSGLTSLLGTVNRGSGSARTSSATSDKSNNSASDSAKKSSSSSSANSSSITATPTTTGNSAAKPFAVPATPATPAAAAAGTGPTGILLSDLQRYLSDMRPAAGGASLPLQPTPPLDVDLSEALLNAESIQGVLNDPSLVRELSPHLPEVNSDQPDPQRLRSTLLSPQFKQAVSMFGAALRSGQIGPVVEQFQVGESAVLAAFQGNMEEFVKALETTNLNTEKKEGEASKEGQSKSDAKPDETSKDGDEKMNEG